MSTRAELRSFVGLCSYYRKFVNGFAKISRLITKFLNTKHKFEKVTEEMRDAIDKLKKALTSKPPLQQEI